MVNKVNFIPAINFINLLHTRRDEGNLKNKPESRKNEIAILFDEFWWVHFIYIEPKCLSRFYFRSFVNH